MGAGDIITVYYNPDCSKCRQAAALLEERKLEFEKREYLTDPPDRQELERLMTLLGTDHPRTLVRTKDKLYDELGLVAGNAEAILDAITSHPALLQRPIVVRGGRALIARPPERLLDLL